MNKLIRPALALLMSLSLMSCKNSDTDKKENSISNKTSKTTTMKPIEITKADFLTKVANFETSPNEWKYLGDKPAIIDFYASWCGPCKMIAPILDDLAVEYAEEIVIYKVNTEEEQELAASFGIRSIPTLLFIPMEGQPQMVNGAMPKDQFKKTINEVLLQK